MRVYHILCFLLFTEILLSQSYFSNVISSQDTSRAGVFLETDSISNIYIKVFTRCEPNAQSCGHIVKIDNNGNQLWRLEQPDFFVSNDNNFFIRINKLYDSSYLNYLSDSLTYDRTIIDLHRASV